MGPVAGLTDWNCPVKENLNYVFQYIISIERLKHIKVDDEPVCMELYQEDIRDRFIEILAQSGLEASQFSSLDGDETFLKIWLPEQGQVIDFMADALHYNMPLKETVYQGI